MKRFLSEVLAMGVPDMDVPAMGVLARGVLAIEASSAPAHPPLLILLTWLLHSYITASRPGGNNTQVQLMT